MVRIDTISGSGTGFIFETTNRGGAYVVTNYHVIEGSNRVNVRVNDAVTYPATVLGYDAYLDLAVLDICCGSFRPLEFSESSGVKAGTEVIAIGYPLDISGSATVTRGIVSAVRYDTSYRSWVIQTDAPINYGNSGGPLLLATGEVIGVNTFIYEREISQAEGLGFAIAAQSITEILSSLKQGTRVGIPTLTPSPTPIGVRWRTYNNREFNYTIDLPQDWIIDDSDKDYVEFSQPDDYAYLSVFVPDWFIGSAVSELDDWLNRQQREENPVVYEVLERDHSRLADGTQIAYVRYLHQSESKYCIDVVEEILVVSSGSSQKSLWLESRVCEHSYQEFQPTLDQIRDSIGTP